MKRLESLIGGRINGSIKEFQRSINPDDQSLIKYFEVFPQNYNAYPTIKRNEQFLDTLITYLQKKKYGVNNIEIKNTDYNYDIIKCKVKISGEEVEAVIDTGANFSIINKSLAERLNIPISIDNK